MNAVAERPAPAKAKSRGWAVGDPVVDRHGNPVALCRTFFAPFKVVVAGVVVADYGDDEEAAEAHYAPLLEARREQLGIQLVRVMA